jgi:hypothetical protein
MLLLFAFPASGLLMFSQSLQTGSASGSRGENHSPALVSHSCSLPRVDGVQIPSRTTFSDAHGSTSIHFSEVRQNIAIDHKVFVPNGSHSQR